MTYIGLFSDPDINSDKESYKIVKRDISSPAYGYTHVYVNYSKKNRKASLETLFHLENLIGMNHGVMVEYPIR